jgi:hypothetical protein
LIFTYASFRNQPPGNLFSVQATSGTADLVERNFYIQYANRSGRSLLSGGKSITSRGVQLTLAPSLILPAEEVFWLIISYETSGDPEDAKVIGIWQARENDQVTRRTSAVNLNFSTQDSFGVNQVVATPGSLPSVFSVVNGAIYLVAETGIYYRSDQEAYLYQGQLYSYGTYAKGLTSLWVEWQAGFNAYIESTDDLLGADISIDLATNALEAPPKQPSLDSVATRYWLNNGLKADGGSPKIDGRYSLLIGVDGVSGYEGFFANKIKYKLIGYVDRATGILDNSMSTAGELKPWNPGAGAIILPIDLPRNHAAVYDLIVSFDNTDVISVLGNRNPTISIDFVELVNIQGNSSQAANLIGDLVYQDRDKLLVVPGLFRLPGIASIKVDDAAQGYYIDAQGVQYLADVQPDLANQLVLMSGATNGHCVIRQAGDTRGYTEVLRTVVSTVPGISALFGGGSLTLANQGFSVTVEHPISSGLSAYVREDYPDDLIAGNSKALFTPTVCYLYLVLNGIVYRSSPQSVLTNTSQVFQYSDLTDFTQISSLPSAPDPYFCLFEPNSLAVTSIAGSLTGVAAVRFAYAYESPNYKATAINNQALGTIATARYTLAEAINYSLAKSENLNDLPDKAIARDNLGVYPKVELDNHRNNINNPHTVTATQLGAATVTQLATVNTEIATLKTKIKEVSANYSLGTADHHFIIKFANPAAVNLTLNHTLLSLGNFGYNPYEVTVIRSAGGKVNLVVAGGATLESSGTVLSNIYDAVYLAYRVSSNSWVAIGKLGIN